MCPASIVDGDVTTYKCISRNDGSVEANEHFDGCVSQRNYVHKYEVEH